MWKILLGNKCTHRLSCLLFLLSFLQVIMSTHHIIQYKEEFQLGFSFSHTCYILIIIVVMCSGDRFWAYIFVSFLNYFSLSWKIFRNIGKFLVKELVVYCGTWISLAISLAQTALSWETAQQADPAVWPLYLAESYLCLEMRSVWRSHSLQRSFIPKSVPLAFPGDLCALHPRRQASLSKGEKPFVIGHDDCTREKEMATHSSILAWRIPWTEEPGRLQ